MLSLRVSIAVALAVCTSCSGTTPEEEAAAKSEREEGIATAINLSGNLCAKVEWIGPVVDTGEFQVTCAEYRDPKKSDYKNNMVVYMVDSETLAVRPMGGG